MDLTAEDLARIAAKSDGALIASSGWGREYARDVPRLLAEIERLRSEVERLRQAADSIERRDARKSDHESRSDGEPQPDPGWDDPGQPERIPRKRRPGVTPSLICHLLHWPRWTWANDEEDLVWLLVCRRCARVLRVAANK